MIIPPKSNIGHQARFGLNGSTNNNPNNFGTTPPRPLTYRPLSPTGFGNQAPLTRSTSLPLVRSNNFTNAQSPVGQLGNAGRITNSAAFPAQVGAAKSAPSLLQQYPASQATSATVSGDSAQRTRDRQTPSPTLLSLDLSSADPRSVSDGTAFKGIDLGRQYSTLTLPAGVDRIADEKMRKLDVQHVEMPTFMDTEIDLQNKSLKSLHTNGRYLDTIRVNEHADVRIKQNKSFKKITVQRMRDGNLLREHAPANHFFQQPLDPKYRYESPNQTLYSPGLGLKYSCRHLSAFEDKNFSADEASVEDPKDIGLVKNRAEIYAPRYSEDGLPKHMYDGLESLHHRLKSNSLLRSVFAPDQLGEVMAKKFQRIEGDGRITSMIGSPNHITTFVLQTRGTSTGIRSYHAYSGDVNEVQPVQVATENPEDVKKWKLSDFFSTNRFNKYYPPNSYADSYETPRGVHKSILETPLSDADVKAQQLEVHLATEKPMDASLLAPLRQLGHEYSSLLPSLMNLPSSELIPHLEFQFVRHALMFQNDRVIGNHFALLKSLHQASKLSRNSVAQLATTALANGDPANKAIIVDALTENNAGAIRAYTEGLRDLAAANILRKSNLPAFKSLWNPEAVEIAKTAVSNPSAANHEAGTEYAKLLQFVGSGFR